MKSRLIDLLDKLNSAPDQMAAWETTTQYFQDLQFSIVNYGLASKKDGALIGILSNMNDDWLRHYFESEYHDSDPLLKHLMEKDTDIVCTRENWDALPSPDPDEANKMFNEIGEMKLYSSILTPDKSIYSDNVGGIALWSEQHGEALAQLVDAHREDILIGSALAQNCLKSFMFGREKQNFWQPLTKRQNRLSPREREVLKWVSAGYRIDRIADKMNIANVTVHFHMTTIKRKLHAKTREQAIAIAVSQRLIEL